MGEDGFPRKYAGSAVVERDSGEQVRLTPMENRVWNLFGQGGPRVIRPEEVYEAARESMILFDPNAVHNLISRIREKMGSRSVLTLSGVGYVWGALIPQIAANGVDRSRVYEEPLKILGGDRAAVYRTIYDAGDRF